MAHDTFGIYVAKQHVGTKEIMSAVCAIIRQPKLSDGVKCEALRVLQAGLSKPVSITITGASITMQPTKGKRTRRARRVRRKK